MSIRLRLTLLYSAILALTLIALGIGIYAAVSNITLGAASDAVNSEVRTVSISLQTHLGPNPNSRGPQGPYQNGAGAAPGLNHGQNPPPDQGPWVNLGSFSLPPDVASQSAVQLRSVNGTVLYQSADLKAAHVTLPLSTSARQNLRPGMITHTVVSTGNQRLLLASTLLTSHGTAAGILQVARSLHDVDATLSTLRQILLAGGGVATLLACGAGWWLAGTALRPIRRITQSAQAIGEVQDFGRRVTYVGPRDEVGRLAATLNGMLERLQDAYQTQRRFAADASHELRTPLTSIRGNLGLLQREPPIAEADRVAVLSDLVSESERLSRLVNDLLILARSDTGRQLRQEPVALGPLLADLIRLLGVSYPGRPIHVGGNLEVAVLGDPDALTQVLLILLDNALKFTPAEGTVSVDARKYDGLVSISVRDTGPGIDPEALPHIFKRFYQGDTARAGSGAGLGLAIAKALIDGQHGNISVESEVGRGSVFTVTLPSAPVSQTPAPVRLSGA